MAELAGYLQREIAQRGWTQREAAARAGISKSGLTTLLTDPTRVPDLPTLKKIAHGFEIPLRRLLALAGYAIESDDTDEIALLGLTDEQRRFLQALNPEKKAALIDLARRMLEG